LPDILATRPRTAAGHPRGRPSGRSGRRRVIDFSSNDYLGLPSPQRRQAVVDAAEARRQHGSRLLRDRESFAEIERRFAAFKAPKRALYFSSGYLANLAVLRRSLPKAATSSCPTRATTPA
jgi:8-amino-7-oxononanoate synthase